MESKECVVRPQKRTSLVTNGVLNQNMKCVSIVAGTFLHRRTSAFPNFQHISDRFLLPTRNANAKTVFQGERTFGDHCDGRNPSKCSLLVAITVLPGHRLIAFPFRIGLAETALHGCRMF